MLRKEVPHQVIAIFVRVFTDAGNQTNFQEMLHIQSNREDLLAKKGIKNRKLLKIGKIKLNVFSGFVFVVVFSESFDLEKIVPLR